jgi:hypothetical protein
MESTDHKMKHGKTLGEIGLCGRLLPFAELGSKVPFIRPMVKDVSLVGALVYRDSGDSAVFVVDL